MVVMHRRAKIGAMVMMVMVMVMLVAILVRIASRILILRATR